MLPISEIENRIKYVFSDKQLLESAFIHSSVAHERNINSNERMEFFGDAILEFVVSEYLFTNYPDKDEGDYSKFRAYLVSAKTLSEVVKKLGLLKFLQISNIDIILSKKLPANLYEAVLCAIFLDSNILEAKKFINYTLGGLMSTFSNFKLKDAKTEFQEIAQSKNIQFEYRLLERSGADNDPRYITALYVEGKPIAQGQGKRIQEAEQNAAKQALNILLK